MLTCRARTALAAAGFAALSLPALAGDLNPPAGPVAPTPGPNAGTVVNSTNTPGDQFTMFVISAPGKYRLGAGFNIADGLSGIRITSPDVWLDMGGFSISSTSPEPIAGIGIVIDVPGSGAATVRIENGTVTGYTAGVAVFNFPTNAASHVVLEKVSLTNSLTSGLSTQGAHSLRLREVTASGNHSSGINAPNAAVNAQSLRTDDNDLFGVVAGPKSMLDTVQASNNDSDGVQLGSGASAVRVQANNNGGSGVSAPDGDARVTEFTVSGNAQHGITGTTNMVVGQGHAIGNGQNGVNVGTGVQNDVTSRNNQQGLKATGAVRVRNSRMTGNASFGADVGAGSTMEDCNFNSNATGVRVGARSTLDNCSVIGNTGNGLQGADHVTVTGSIVGNNGNFGITLGGFAIVTQNNVDSNIIGVSVGDASRVCANTVSKCADGIQANGTAVIENNTVAANANGIVVAFQGSGTQVQGNTILAQGGPGVLLNGNNNSVVSNTFRNNASDVQDFGASNLVAPIVTNPLIDCCIHHNLRLTPTR